MTPRLQEKYKNEVVQAMVEKFGYKNIMEVPKLEKIVINMGVGEAKDNQKILESAVNDFSPPWTGSIPSWTPPSPPGACKPAVIPRAAISTTPARACGSPRWRKRKWPMYPPLPPRS